MSVEFQGILEYIEKLCLKQNKTTTKPNEPGCGCFKSGWGLWEGLPRRGGTQRPGLGFPPSLPRSFPWC